MSDYDEYGYRRECEHEREHKGEYECHKKFKKVCEVDASEDMTITVPVAVHAYVNTRDVELRCNGHEIIKEPPCKLHVKKFKIRQKIHACIPIDFVAECHIGEGQVDFDLQEG